jgi:hypothetical protein
MGLQDSEAFPFLKIPKKETSFWSLLTGRHQSSIKGHLQGPLVRREVGETDLNDGNVCSVTLEVGLGIVIHLVLAGRIFESLPKACIQEEEEGEE